MKRYGYENKDLPTWKDIWSSCFKKLKGEKQTSKLVEVPQFLPCGCENPAWEKAEFSQITVSGTIPFDILESR